MGSVGFVRVCSDSFGFVRTSDGFARICWNTFSGILHEEFSALYHASTVNRRKSLQKNTVQRGALHIFRRPVEVQGPSMAIAALHLSHFYAFHLATSRTERSPKMDVVGGVNLTKKMHCPRFAFHATRDRIRGIVPQRKFFRVFLSRWRNEKAPPKTEKVLVLHFMPRETNRTTKPKHRNRCITPEYELFFAYWKINGEETYEKPQIIENRGGGPSQWTKKTHKPRTP